jgi:hypothetical protein
MEQFLSFTLVGAFCPLLFFHPCVDGSFKLCIIGLCTSSDVEAGFKYPISKKKCGLVNVLVFAFVYTSIRHSKNVPC